MLIMEMERRSGWSLHSNINMKTLKVRNSSCVNFGPFFVDWGSNFSRVWREVNVSNQICGLSFCFCGSKKHFILNNEELLLIRNYCHLPWNSHRLKYLFSINQLFNQPPFLCKRFRTIKPQFNDHLTTIIIDTFSKCNVRFFFYGAILRWRLFR